MQKKFLISIIEKVNSPSLSELAKRLGLNYSTMKNYFIERRTLPETLFFDLCFLGKIDYSELNVKFIEGNRGQIIGGKKGKK